MFFRQVRFCFGLGLDWSEFSLDWLDLALHWTGVRSVRFG